PRGTNSPNRDRTIIYGDTKADRNHSRGCKYWCQERVVGVMHRQRTRDGASGALGRWVTRLILKVRHQSVTGVLLDEASVVFRDSHHLREEQVETCENRRLFRGAFRRPG